MVSGDVESAFQDGRALVESHVHGADLRSRNGDDFVRDKQRLTYLECKQG
jgi:hypothetical protein